MLSKALEALRPRALFHSVWLRGRCSSSCTTQILCVPIWMRVLVYQIPEIRRKNPQTLELCCNEQVLSDGAVAAVAQKDIAELLNARASKCQVLGSPTQHIYTRILHSGTSRKVYPEPLSSCRFCLFSQVKKLAAVITSVRGRFYLNLGLW